MIFRARLQLLSQTQPVNTDQNGTAFQLSDLEDNNAGQFRLYYDVTQSNTEASNSNVPNTTSVYFEHSIDGSTWINLCDPKVMNADATERAFVEIPALLPHVRVRCIAGGSNKPNHKCVVYLVSNQAFRCWDASDVHGKARTIG